MTWTVRRCFAVLLLVASAAAGEPPTLSRDPETGVYSITYGDESGARRRVDFQGLDQVMPELSLSVTGTGAFIYRYEVANGAAAKQPIWSLDLPCEKDSTSVPGARRIRVWKSGAQPPGEVIYYCHVRLSDPKRGIPGIAPGTRDGGVVALESARLPGIRQAEAIGSADLPMFPGFRDETPESISDL